MRLTVSGWLRYAGPVAMAALAISGGGVAVSQEDLSGDRADPPASEQGSEAPGLLTADEVAAGDGAPAALAIPDPPTLAPRRESAGTAPATTGRPAESVRIPFSDPASGSADESLEVKVRSSSPGESFVEAEASPGEKPLEPIPDPDGPLTVEVGTASFNGVVPGLTTLAKLQEAWGTAEKIAKREGVLVYLYSVDPFEKVEVSAFGDKVASIVIRLDQTFPAETVAEQLDLSKIRPVLVSNPLGEILGQAYPERGVLFAFAPAEEPTRPSMEVAQIILEPVTAEPFILRAETYLDQQIELSAADLEQAIKLDPANHRAQWLLARALSALGEQALALEAGGEAVRLAPHDAQYRASYAQILGQVERFDEAIAEAQKALADSENRPHVEARAYCLLGDLFGSGPNPDYKQAIANHTKAVQVAEPLAEDPHPAIGLAARQVLLDAHLGAAHDIAWGNWNQKEVAVSRWLERASELAGKLSDDAAVVAEYRFRVAQRAMAAHVGLCGQLDPTPWTEETLRSADAVLDSARDRVKKQRILWELGAALYDAVQIYQMRGENDLALKCGEQAVLCFEEVAKAKQTGAADHYLLGRLYFRLGAIQAIGKQDHQQAVSWFDKAVAEFDQAGEQVAAGESGRLGETLVSMGVSYWETGRREKATELTGRGVKLIEKAVDEGTLDKTALEIPYGNLAAMRRTASPGGQGLPPAQNASRDKSTSLK